MMFSRFFIDRPIFATVISLVIMLAGILSIQTLPIAQYPDLTPLTIVVDAQYPGASAEIISETVLAPIEQKINGVENMIYMNSVASGSNGMCSINVFFEIGTDPDNAMINVNNRVQMATSSLPEDVRKYGVTVQKKSTSILQVLALYSDDERYDDTYLGNYALLNIVDELKRINGVGDAIIMGGNNYSIRIWLKPDVLAKLNISTSEVVRAVQSQNMQRAAGGIGKKPMDVKVERSYMIIAKGRLTDAKSFEDIILRANPDGTALRLRDVADVKLGAQTHDVFARTKGHHTAPIMIYLSPGANAIATAKAVDDKLEILKQAYPKGIHHTTTFETTTFVQHSIIEVVKALFESIFLVFLVILLFLKNLKATLIPCLAVPVSIVGAFAGMLLFGFSINTLTLFGLVLAIGIVVDDAIVVIENVERIMRSQKLAVRDATIKAMDEVSGALVAIVLVLCAVFIPVSFMGGLAGTMYKQFAITIAVSVIISGLCALTLTPALCVIFLGGEQHNSLENNQFFVQFDNFFNWLTEKYILLVTFFIRHTKTAMFVILAIILCTILLFRATPGSLLPEEDQGVCLACAIMDPAASLDRSTEVITLIDKVMLEDKNVKKATRISGFDMLSGTTSTSAATEFFILTDWSERKNADQSASAITRKIMRIGSKITDGIVLAFCPPAIVGMSMTGGFEGFVQQIGNTDNKAMEIKIKDLIQAASKAPELINVKTTFSANTPQFKMIVDDLKALSLGVPIDEIYATVAATFNAYYINDFSKSGRGFKVMIQAKDSYRSHPDKINEIYVKSNEGVMIPLSAFVKLEPTLGTIITERFNVFPSAKILGDPAPGYTSGEAISAMERIAKEVLGNGYILSWTGSAYQEKATGGSSNSALLLGLLVVFLILAAQYERWTLPIAVILAVPFALFGAILAVALRGFSNDVYFQIALITLVGLSAKNAILIIEFAVMLRKNGESIIDSAINAARLRFRPIVMTSLAFILGCVPLAISSGAGCASRHSIGTGVIGGMLGATIIAPLFIPLFYKIVTTFSEKFKK